jgi:hypothetical protein
LLASLPYADTRGRPRSAASLAARLRCERRAPRSGARPDDSRLDVRSARRRAADRSPQAGVLAEPNQRDALRARLLVLRATGPHGLLPTAAFARGRRSLRAPPRRCCASSPCGRLTRGHLHAPVHARAIAWIRTDDRWEMTSEEGSRPRAHCSPTRPSTCGMLRRLTGVCAGGRGSLPMPPGGVGRDRVTKLRYRGHGHHLRGNLDGEPRGVDGCE